MTDANADSDALLNAVIPFAQGQLKKRGVFLPFGAVVLVDGKVELAAVMFDPDTAAPEMRAALLAMFKQRARDGDIRGAAVCYDGNAVDQASGQRTEAICVDIQHRTERCATLFLPYAKGWLGRRKYGEMFGTVAEAQVFTTTELSTASE